MTDLEKLAEDIVDELGDTESLAFLMPKSFVLRELKRLEETAHAAGRIEGLKEAAGIASKGWWPAASDIRARIQELEDKK